MPHIPYTPRNGFVVTAESPATAHIAQGNCTDNNLLLGLRLAECTRNMHACSSRSLRQLRL